MKLLIELLKKLQRKKKKWGIIYILVTVFNVNVSRERGVLYLM
jgi:hypothetical protein